MKRHQELYWYFLKLMVPSSDTNPSSTSPTRGGICNGVVYSSIINSKSKTFLAWCFSFLLGITAISLFDYVIPGVRLYFVLLISLGLIIIFWREKTARFFLLCILFCLLGFVRYRSAFPGADTDNLSAHAPLEAGLIGYVAAEPDARIDGTRYVVEATSWSRPEQGTLHGKLIVKATSYPAFHYGDIVALHCQLQKPAPIADAATGKIFHYEKYLAVQGVFTICGRPSMKKIGDGGATQLMAWLLRGKDRLATQVSMLWHEPYAGFMAGILYGYRGGLGKLNDDFARVGVSHIPRPITPASPVS